MDCLFCKIAHKEIKAKVIYEDNATIALLDIMPSAPGHIMVIPKAHGANILELGDGDLAHVWATVKKMDEMIVREIAPDGITIGINQGRASGQEVDHLHIHLIPRWKNDSGRAIQSVVSNKDEIKRAEIEKKLLG